MARTKLKRGDDLTGPGSSSHYRPGRGEFLDRSPSSEVRLRRNIAASDSSDEDWHRRRWATSGPRPRSISRGAGEEMFAEHTEGEVIQETSKEVVDLSKLEENEDWEALVKAARKQLSDDPINADRAQTAFVI